MARTERSIREFLSRWQFWVCVAYIGLCAVVVALYFLYGRQAKEEAFRAANLKASAVTQVATCFTSVKNAPLTRGFVAAHLAIIENGLIANRAAIYEHPNDPLNDVRRASVKRLVLARRNALKLNYLFTSTTPKRKTCVDLAARLDVDASPYTNHH